MHPIFDACVQSQFVCRSVPRGGATLVVSPGDHYTRPVDATLFKTDTGRDFCVCTAAGYAALRPTCARGRGSAWLPYSVALAHAPRHGNKLADVGVDPNRRVVYIAWQSRDLIKKYEGGMEAVRALTQKDGGHLQRWHHRPLVHARSQKPYRGSHYSNGKGLTKVMYTADRPPVYDDALAATVESSM